VDPLEQAKQALDSSQKQLSDVVQSSDTTLQQLKQRRIKLGHELNAAARRYDTVKELTERLCDPCWGVLPVLGNHFDVSAALPSQRCINCNLPLQVNTTHCRSVAEEKVAMPPGNTSTIDLASAARKYSKKAGNEKVPQCSWNRIRNRVVFQERSDTMTWKDSMEYSSLNFRERGNSCMNSQNKSPMPGKQHFIREAQNHKEEKETELKRVEYAIPQWKEYHKKHKAELSKVKASLIDLQGRHREVLQNNLHELGGSISTNNCAICLDHPKQIAFQCGHQCCTMCSISLLLCHICRATIVQRIRLYD